MKNVLLLTLFFFNYNISAFEIKALGNSVELIGGNCSENQSIVKSLEDWTKVKCQKISSSTCDYNIAACLPKNILDTVGNYSNYEGPNCYNLALVMKNILPALRYSGPEEIAFYLKSPLCRNLKNDEERKPGDIGAIRELYKENSYEFHAFIYISEKIAFSKNGETYESSYDLQTLENVYGSYGIASNSKCRTNEIDLKSNCLRATSYFRCSSLNEYVEKAKEINPKILGILNQLSKFEKNILESYLIKGANFNSTSTQSILELTSTLTKYYDELLQNGKNLNAEEKFLITSIRLRMTSIAEQLKKSFHLALADQIERELSKLPTF